MCNHENREQAMVVVRTDAAGKPTVWCDPCIAGIVKALNDGGLVTVASCCGHGERPGVVSLADGRELLILPDYAATRRAEFAISTPSQLAALVDAQLEALRLRSVGEQYAHRLATMLECALLNRIGSWDEGNALLQEYRDACAEASPPPPTFMGEPLPG